MICEIQILGAYDEGEACDASFKDFLRQFGCRTKKDKKFLTMYTSLLTSRYTLRSGFSNDSSPP